MSDINFAKLDASPPTAAMDGLITIAGRPGVGKSTLMASCPDAIIFSCDGGLRALECRKVICDTWTDLAEGVKTLSRQYEAGDFGYEPVVAIDTVDAARRLLLDEICTKDGSKRDPTQRDYGTASNKLYAFLKYLAKRPFLVVALAHTIVKDAQDSIPASYTLALGDTTNRTLAAQSDLFLLALEEKGGKRYLLSDWAGDSKDRTGFLPAKMPLDWDAFAGEFKAALGKANSKGTS